MGAQQATSCEPVWGLLSNDGSSPLSSPRGTASRATRDKAALRALDVLKKVEKAQTMNKAALVPGPLMRRGAVRLSTGDFKATDSSWEPRSPTASTGRGFSNTASASPTRKRSTHPRLDENVKPEHRIVVIGDLHGMVHKAKALWRMLEDTLGEQELLRSLVVFLGDYIDRGTYTKELLFWLSDLQRNRSWKGGRTVCLLGNHEFCLLSFLGLLPAPVPEPDFAWRDTWDKVDGIVKAKECDRWWGTACQEERGELDNMHLQGRRWGGDVYARTYGSTSTFASYGVEFGDRALLKQRIPKEHINFLQSCPWVHIEDNPLVGRCVFVHAGLAADGTADGEEQLQRLQSRDARQQQPEALFGREGVLHSPPQMTRRETTIISGHHGKVLFKTNRIILDSCCGMDENPLAALILPETLLVYDTGVLEPRDPALVFSGGRPEGGHARGLALSPELARAKLETTREARGSPCGSPKGRSEPAPGLPQGDVAPLD